jgi:hypothetical protein
VRDDNALLVDVLPTLVDVLDVDIDWEFDGRSLIGDEPPPDTKAVFYGRGPATVPNSLEGLFEAVRRNQARFPADDGWRGVIAVGSLGDFVGRPVDDLDVAPHPSASWTVREADELTDVDAANRVPLVLHGRLQLDGRPPDEALVALNGVVAGVAGDFEQHEGTWRFSALVDFEAFEDGENEVQLLLPDPDGGGRFLRADGP